MRAISAAFLIACAATAFAAETDRPAPDFALPDGSGKTVRLSDFRGKQPVYLDFWASWCIPCRKSFPWMNELQSRYPGVKIIAVNLDEQREDADRFLSAVPARFAIAFDPKAAMARAYDVKVMPSSFLIDREGVLRVEHRGFRDNDGAALEKQFASLSKSNH